jgi:protein involved in polysaccharide export with SLBB domain
MSPLSAFGAPFRLVAALVILGLSSCLYAQSASTTPAPPAVSTQSSSNPAPAPYKLGPEDQILISVVNHTELTGIVTVAADGTVNLFAAGQIQAQGLTLPEFTAAVVLRFQTNKAVGLLHPVVSCALQTARMQRVYVLGAVKSPGIYDAKPGWRISEAIAAAGGAYVDQSPTAAGAMQPQTSDFTVSILRAAGGAFVQASLSDALQGKPDKDLSVAPGDVVTVNPVDLFTIYVNGDVAKPGVYQIRKDSTDVMKAIAMAGGFIPTSSTAHVKITHPDGQSEMVDLSAAVQLGADVKGPKLVPGDLVLVPELQSKVAVLGLVKQPGVYPMPDGKEVHLNDALGFAQGYDTKRARLSQVAVVYQVNGKTVHKIYDFGKYLRKGDLAMNPVIPVNSMVYVPETNSIDWADVFNGLSGAGSIIFGLHTIAP